jgi:hypothetical protein
MADKEWTVMLYFAGDNSLSPLIVSQLKAIKDAGFHRDVDVLVHFDSNEAGVPTRVFDVNRKLKKNALAGGILSKVGDGRDSFVRNMAEDNLDPKKDITGAPGSASAKLRDALENPDSSNAGDALKNFIGFCRENHRAKNYILFVVGHGLVVGNDAFLPDDNPVSAITLEGLRDILEGFTKNIADDKSEESPKGGAFQLLALHSCSMSAIEVAYQLKGTAKYMIGSEGIAYLEGFPYRQLLKKIFNFVDKAQDEDEDEEKHEANDPYAEDPQRLISKLYFHTLFNAADFMISGYSLDLCLCNLELDFQELSTKIGTLVLGLKRALESERTRELLLLAHWESQSYWGESYTDLFDFCFCLRKRCRLALGLPNVYLDGEQPDEKGTELGELAKSCSDVMALLEWERSRDLAQQFSKRVVHSCHFGPKYQYSHGLSIFFPWSRPIDDDPVSNVFKRSRVLQDGKEDKRGVMERYRDYLFNKELEKVGEGQSWGSFLDLYFEKTRRTPRVEEDRMRVRKGEKIISGEADATDEAGPIVFLAPNSLGAQSDNPFPALTDEKQGPRVGGSCTCPSIKNYVNEITLSKIILKRTFKQ